MGKVNEEKININTEEQRFWGWVDTLNKNSLNILVYYMSDTFLNPFYILTHFILATVLGGRCHYHF